MNPSSHQNGSNWKCFGAISGLIRLLRKLGIKDNRMDMDYWDMVDRVEQ